MPDRRFEEAYARVASERRSRGLSAASRDDLVAALAVAGLRDAAFANALATELLNRLRRAPYIGAAIALAAACLAILVTNWIDVGRPLVLESGVRAGILDILAIALALGATLAFLAFRGQWGFRAQRSRRW